MLPFPGGTTHSRLNKQKRVNFFNLSDATNPLIWNNKWEPYGGRIDNLLPIGSGTDTPKSPPKKKAPEKKKVKKPVSVTPIYDPVIPTFAEEVMEYIPSPILRALIAHYKTAEVVEVEINVKTTHTIVG